MKSLKINIVLFLLLGLASCKKEDAAYQSIPQVAISNIENEYSILNVDLLNITPAIQMDGQPLIDDSKYDFLWINLGDATITISPENADTISTSRNLVEAKMGYPTGKYEFLFKMTERATGIHYSKLFEVTISSELQNGFLVLTSENGQPRLDMVVDLQAQFTTHTDVLGKTNSALRLAGTPYFLSRIVNPFTGSKVYIGTSEGTNNVALESFYYTPSMNIAYNFRVGNRTPENFKPTGMLEGFQNTALLQHNDEVYYTSFSDGPFSTAINNFGSGNTPFKPSKWVAPYMTNSYNGNFILFDDEKQKFYNYKAGSLGCEELPTGDKFDYHIKKKLVYMDYSTNNTGEIFAVLKNNNDSKHYLARFTAGYRTNIGTQLSFEELNIPEIENATAFATSALYGYLFYAVGGKVYSYDSGSKAVKEMINYGDRTITFLHVDKPEIVFYPPSKVEGQLYVGSYGNTANSGELEILKPAPIQGPFEKTHHFKGLGKIVDILRLY